jgi:uncharacterized protein with beta-barrel porin domain
MRAYLLTTTAAVALLAAMPVHAQDATWTGAGGGNWNTNGNWSPATVPTGTATFDNTGLTQSLNISASTSINTLLFAAGAPAYSYAIISGARFDIVGAGIINNSPNAPSFFLASISILAFSNSSTAGNAVIATNGLNSVTTFANSSTAGTATITNTSFGSTTFNNTSTAGSASITSALSGFVSFLGTSTAGNATITTNFNGTTFFNSNATADNATIVTNNGGSTQFSAFSTGGNAAFTTQAGGVFDMSAGVIIGMTAGSIEGQGTYLLGSKTLTVGGNNLSTTVSGTISDGGVSGGTGGSLTKVGTGTLTLAGTNNYTGATTVTGGTLFLTGDISSSSGVTVNAGTTLGGTGMAPGVTMNGGTLMPGMPNAIGTLNVAGNLVFTSAATYLININSTTASQTNVTGTATLNGATVQVVDDSNITKRQRYTLLTATGGGVSGTFNPDVVGVKNKVELFYDANHVYLCDHCKTTDILTPGQLPFLPGSPPPTNIGQVGGAIDAAIDADVTLPTRAGNLLGLSRPQLIGALTQLTGENHTGAQQAGFQVMDRFLRLLLDPFAATRADGGAGSAIGFAPERSAAFPADVALAYASVLKAPAAPAQPAVAARPWNIWASGYGGNAHISGDPLTIGSHDTSVRDYGYAAGLDYRIAPDTTVGFALGGAGTDWSLASGLGGGRSDVFQAGLYGSKRWGAAYVSGALAYANYWMSTDRFVSVFGTDHLTSSFTAHNFGGRIESGYRFAMPVVAITPYGALQAQRLSLPGYSEIAPSGSSTFALTYNGQTASTTRSELGAWFDKTVLVGLCRRRDVIRACRLGARLGQ